MIHLDRKGREVGRELFRESRLVRRESQDGLFDQPGQHGAAGRLE
jgi:hypothetical protein